MSPLERAARAAADAFVVGYVGYTAAEREEDYFEEAVAENLELGSRIARAVLQAIREPSPAMVSANSDAAGPDDGRTIEDWRAMIDAALEEG